MDILSVYGIIIPKEILQIIKWDVKSRDFRIRLVSHASFPYCIDIPSWNPGMAIIGLGESNIKLWRFGSIDTAMSDGNFYDSEALWRELQGQIGYVKSHPSQEGLLFYSTEYGRVGMWNLHASKNQRFKTYHNVKGKETPSISYVADMSQALEDPDAQNMVITCGLDGAVYLHRMSHPTRHAVNLLKLIMQANPSWELTKAVQPDSNWRSYKSSVRSLTQCYVGKAADFLLRGRRRWQQSILSSWKH